MTAGTGGTDSGGRPGLRANALPAGSFARLRVVDARVSDALLDVLEDAGVAAYVEPSAGEVGVYRDVRAHGAPSDDLYVDASRRDVAIAVLAAELPGMLAEVSGDPVEEDDAAFAALVAAFHEDRPKQPAAWPESENAAVARSDDEDDEWYAAPARPAAPADEEDHFVPPPPPPLPRLSGGKLRGLVLLLGGFVLMLALPLVGFEAETAMAIGIVTTAVGAGTLVWYMRDAPSDSDPDDGAVV